METVVPEKRIQTWNVAQVARRLMNDYGLGHWTFQLDRAQCRCGFCRHGPRIISLSYHYVEWNADDLIIDTILHEIAHALCGYKAKHGPVWKAKCLEVGCRPIRCKSADEVTMPKGKWKAICPGCQREFRRYKKVRRGHVRCCRVCGPDKGTLEYKVDV